MLQKNRAVNFRKLNVFFDIFAHVVPGLQYLNKITGQPRHMENYIYFGISEKSLKL